MPKDPTLKLTVDTSEKSGSAQEIKKPKEAHLEDTRELVIQNLTPNQIVESHEVAEVASGHFILRQKYQSNLHGNLTYLAKLSDESVELQMRVQLPPDEQKTFQIKINKNEIESPDAIRHLVSKELMDGYINHHLGGAKGPNSLPNSEMRKPLSRADLKHIFEMIADVHTTFSAAQNNAWLKKAVDQLPRDRDGEVSSEYKY